MASTMASMSICCTQWLSMLSGVLQSTGVTMVTRFFTLSWCSGAVTEAEHAALANAEDVDLVDPVTFAHDVDAAIDITVDVIVERQVFVGAVRDNPSRSGKRPVPVSSKPCDRRTVFLDVGHVGAVNQRVDDQRRDFILYHTGRRLVSI